LLAKVSKMPVAEVQGDMRAEANHVYVIPPRCNLVPIPTDFDRAWQDFQQAVVLRAWG
jgi:hypothetical protein